MKHIINHLITIASTGLIVFSCSAREITCTIKGKIHGRDSDTLILVKATENPDFDQLFVPIKDSVFEFKLVVPYEEVYELIFKDELDRGYFRPIYFVSENGEIDFELYNDMYYDKNKIIGSSMTKILTDYYNSFYEEYTPKYKPINDSIQDLISNNKYYNEEWNKLLIELQKTEDQDNQIIIRNIMNEMNSSGENLTPEAIALTKKSNSIIIDANKWRNTYINENSSIVSYFLLFMDLISIEDNFVKIKDIKDSYFNLSKKYPTHPYTAKIKDILIANETIKIGGKYLDFSLPDINGTYYKISEIISNKCALIDFWSIVEAKCFQEKRSILLPLYQEYSDKGFTICSISSVINNTDKLREIIEQEKKPWINLIELNNNNHIWDKYGLTNSAGGMILVDKQGTILAIDPSADELKKLLFENLK